VDDTKPSKSARKRAYLALQKLGREAVMEARGIKAHGALRRQKQYIGKLMGRVDPEPIREALERLRRNS
jgi:ribosome-associated protein